MGSTGKVQVVNVERLTMCKYTKPLYRIHSNKRPGRLDKSVRVGAYLFHYLLQGSSQTWMIWAVSGKFPVMLNSVCKIYEQNWEDG